MANRFNFKLFDTQEKKYIKDFVIDKEYNIFFVNLRKDLIKLDKDRFKLMQSTGLVDKNGKEIYEGDIIKYIDREDIIKQIYYSEDNSQMYYANKNKSFYACFYEIFPEEVEVIGNIYENKELLGE